MHTPTTNKSVDCNSIKWWGKTFQSTIVLVNLYGLMEVSNVMDDKF